MTFKHVFLSTAAASSLLFAVAALEPAAFSLATKAQAATNISVNINFYDYLAPYGSWVSYHDRYVWIPKDVDHRWQPYTEGHWGYTRRYGWIWVSDERFGWATYHYGRWGYARDIGWYWVPGRRWASAWVAWSYDGDNIAWAPLPPDHDDANIVISFGDIPDNYWQAVPVSDFLSVNLSGHVYRDRDRVRRVTQRGVSRTVRILNKIVLNNVIKVDDIEKKTRKKVVVLEEKVVDNPDAAGKVDSNSVAIFNPEVKEEPNAKPTKIQKVEEIAKMREVKPSGSADAITDESVTKPKTEATSAAVPQDVQQNAGQPTKAEAATIVEPAKPIQKETVIPSFDTVQVEPTGEALIAGQAEPGSDVVVKLNGQTVGTAMANADGAFVVTTDKPLPSGSGALSIEAKSNGIVVASENSAAINVKSGAVDTPRVAELKPAEPIKVIQAPAAPNPALPSSKTITLDTVRYDQTGNIVFGGHGPAGGKMQLYVDNNAYGLAFINDKGTWSFAGLSPLTVGLHALRAVEIGDDGALKSRIEMPFYREEPAKVATAPLIPAMPEAPKPAEVATAREAPISAPPIDGMNKRTAAAPDEQALKKSARAPADEQAITSENKETEVTASIDPPDIERTVEAQTVPVDEKKKAQATASIDQPDIEKTVKAPAAKPTTTVDEKKKTTASIDQPAIKKTVEAPADELAATVDGRKKKKKNALSKLRLQSTKRVMLKTNVPDVAAESWKTNCSAMFGGFNKSSEWYISSSGKRVSCAKRPKNARG